MTNTARWWLCGLASVSVGGCTVYDPSLVPVGERDAALRDVVSERVDQKDSAFSDMSASADETAADANADASTDADDDAADARLRDAADAADAVEAADTAEAHVPNDAEKIEAARVCDATCLARCTDRIMNGPETRLDCGGDCPADLCPPAPAITNLVVNDNNIGQDGIFNNVQWSIGVSFADGQPAYGDRPFTLSASDLASAAPHLVGKPWIRTAADSKLYSSTTMPVASATVSGSFIYIATDERQNLSLVANDGYTYQFLRFDFREDDVVRRYTIWRKPILSSPLRVTFPSVTSVASFYLIIVE